MRNRTRISSLDAFGLRDQRNRIYPALEAGDGSTLSLDFTAMSSLDSRFTFSRTSTATFINSSGLVKYADHNLFLNTVWTSTTAPTGWLQVSLGGGTDGTFTYNGDGSISFSTGSSQRCLFQPSPAITVANGLTYTIGFEVVSVSGGTTISECLTNNLVTDSFYRNGVSVAGSTAVQAGDILQTVFTTNATSITPRIGLGVGGAISNKTIRIKTPQMNIGNTAATTLGYIANSSTTAAYHAPRFDYNPTTFAPRGLLIEGSATNLVTQSSAMNNWTFTRTTASTPSVTAPDGASTSVLVTGTADVNNHLVQNANSISFTPQNYTFSVWLKAGATNFAQLSFTNSVGFPTSTYVNVNLSNGTLGTVGGTGATATISTAYPNGWYRVTLTANQTLTTSHTGSCLIYLISSATAPRAEASWDASSASVYVWGAQLETGSGASSYIPTGASTEQRAAESCSIAASSSWLNTASGTFVANWHRGDRGGTERSVVSSDYVAGRLLQLNNTDVATSVSLIWWNGNIFRTTGAAINKAAYTYGQTTGSGATLQLPVRLCVNGSAVATGTFGNGTTNGADVPNPVNWTNFVIGAAASSAPYTTASRDWLNNCVRSIKYWPTILPDATLQSLTQ